MRFQFRKENITNTLGRYSGQNSTNARKHEERASYMFAAKKKILAML
jgi:hypothetical protein